MKLSVSKAWEETAAFVERETRLLVPLALALLFLPSVIVGMAAPLRTNGDQEAGIYVVLLVLQLLIGLAGQLAISRLALGHREQLGDSIRHGLRRLPALVGATAIAVFPLSLLTGAVLTMVRAISPGGTVTASPGVALVLLVVLTALLVALVIVGVRCLLNNAIASVEPGGPVRILKRGFAMTKGSAWRLLGAALLFLIGGFVAIFALSSIVGLLVTFLLGRPEPWSVAALLLALVGAAAQAALATVFSVFFARLYAQRAAASGVPSTGA